MAVAGPFRHLTGLGVCGENIADMTGNSFTPGKVYILAFSRLHTIEQRRNKGCCGVGSCHPVSVGAA